MAVSSSLLNLFLIPSVPPSPAIRPPLSSLHHMEPILATIPGPGTVEIKGTFKLFPFVKCHVRFATALYLIKDDGNIIILLAEKKQKTLVHFTPVL